MPTYVNRTDTFSVVLLLLLKFDLARKYWLLSILACAVVKLHMAVYKKEWGHPWPTLAVSVVVPGPRFSGTMPIFRPHRSSYPGRQFPITNAQSRRLGR
jgi:hypothetical protein